MQRTEEGVYIVPEQKEYERGGRRYEQKIPTEIVGHLYKHTSLANRWL